jgi:hypothetical protein
MLALTDDRPARGARHDHVTLATTTNPLMVSLTKSAIGGLVAPSRPVNR